MTESTFFTAAFAIYFVAALFYLVFLFGKKAGRAKPRSPW